MQAAPAMLAFYNCWENRHSYGDGEISPNVTCRTLRYSAGHFLIVNPVLRNSNKSGMLLGKLSVCRGGSGACRFRRETEKPCVSCVNGHRVW